MSDTEGGFPILSSEDAARVHRHRMQLRDRLRLDISVVIPGWGSDQGLTDEQQKILKSQSHI